MIDKIPKSNFLGCLTGQCHEYSEEEGHRYVCSPTKNNFCQQKISHAVSFSEFSKVKCAMNCLEIRLQSFRRE